jgi:hypothetical protein
MMKRLYAAAPSDDQIDLLVIALQALQDPGSGSHDIPAIDRGRAIVRKWLADNSVSTSDHL